VDGAQLHAAEKHHSPEGHAVKSVVGRVSKMVAARNMDIMDNNGTSVPAADFLRCFAEP
jgi:hypothetical protein